MINTSNNYSESPEGFIIFCDYFINSFANGITTSEYPIIINNSNLVNININCYIHNDLTNFIKSKLKSNLKVFYLENYLVVQGKYNVPYVVFKLDNFSNYLFVTLLYPGEEYFTQLFKYRLLPTITLSFYDVNNEVIGQLKLTPSDNWLDIYTAIQKNPVVTKQIFNGIVNNFGINSIINFFSDNYL